MEPLNQFKNSLLSARVPASKITVKNYLADINKFASWYESTYQRPFPPPAFHLDLIQNYLEPIKITSPRSAKRYQSSLKKFFTYLVSEGMLPFNPLENIQENELKSDPMQLKEFGNYLYNSNANPITIKNYILDIRQFLNWASRVTGELLSTAQEQNAHAAEPKASNQIDLFAKINSFMIEEYKNRLLNEANMSPLSVNRKLSSLRKYLSWANSKGLLRHTPKIVNLELTSSPQETNQTEPNDIRKLTELQNLTPPPAYTSSDSKSYSGFGPIRFIQKIKTALNIAFDAFVVLSVIKTIEGIKYNLWKATGKEIFTPLPKILKSLQNEPAESIVTKKLALDRLITTSNSSEAIKIKSIPKSVYAPFKISIDSLPFRKKIIFKLKHTRPRWYKKYHSYAFSHYLHFAILLVFATFAGFKIYQRLTAPVPLKTVLGSNVSPGRVISFSGSLHDAGDAPVTRESIIKFGIYNSQTASGSALLWHETQTVKPDSAGNFSTTLGKINKIEQDIFSNNPNLYLGIGIGSDPELIPRQELANIGLSKNSETLQGLEPITGNNAETSNVILALDSSGNLTIGGSASPVFQVTGGEFKLTGQQLSLNTNEGSNGNVQIVPDGTGIIDLQKPLQNTSNNGNIDSALGAVEVDDNFAILASSSAQSALVIKQNGTGDLISASTGSIAKFTVDNNGSG
ncbi:MAG TPA: site-specific integrase, partial [Candidatus Saccharimonadales bacterium]|nr:site-specific integrase [Candidatus Saccharimonadales bacterium]